MKAWFPLFKARMVLAISAALAASGIAALAFVAWQIGTLFPGGKPASLPGAVWLAGLIGLALGALGVFGMLRQLAAIRAEKEREQDRLRRLQDYRRDPLAPADRLDGRREPFISDRRAA